MVAHTIGLRSKLAEAGVVVDDPDAEREMQQVRDREQRHHRREARPGPNASTASGSPMLPQLLNIIGGTNVR